MDPLLAAVKELGVSGGLVLVLILLAYSVHAGALGKYVNARAEQIKDRGRRRTAYECPLGKNLETAFTDAIKAFHAQQRTLPEEQRLFVDGQWFRHFRTADEGHKKAALDFRGEARERFSSLDSRVTRVETEVSGLNATVTRETKRLDERLSETEDSVRAEIRASALDTRAEIKEDLKVLAAAIREKR